MLFENTSVRPISRTKTAIVAALAIAALAPLAEAQSPPYRQKKTVHAGESVVFSFPNIRARPDNDAPTARELPDGATFDPLTATLSWTPDESQVGTTKIYVSGYEGADYHSYEVRVTVLSAGRGLPLPRAIAAAAPAAGPVRWSIVGAPPPNVTYVNGTCAAFDSARRRIVLFDPDDGRTFEWNGVDWTLAGRFAASGAVLGSSFVDEFHVVYDEANARTLLFHSSLQVRDGSPIRTWEWNGASWSEVTSSSPNPGVRRGCMTCYDSARKRVVLAFGVTAEKIEYANDVWEWDGLTRSWSRSWSGPAGAAALNGPARRQSGALACDSARGRLVLFGGFTSDGSYVDVSGSYVMGRRQRLALSDVWEWDGASASWTKIETSAPPRGRYDAGFVYDSARARFVLFAGSGWKQATATGRYVDVTDAYGLFEDSYPVYTDAFAEELGDTWELDPIAKTWKDVTVPSTTTDPQPRFRSSPIMVYDSKKSRTLLWGGWGSSTWGAQDEALWARSSAPAEPVPLISKIDDVWSQPNRPVSIDLTAMPTGNPLKFSADGLPLGASFVQTGDHTARFRWFIDKNWLPTGTTDDIPITVRVTDGTHSDRRTFTIHVSDPQHDAWGGTDGLTGSIPR